jgi:hypothetical protein
MQTLKKAVDLSESGTLTPADWYVVGRVAEAYGLADVAADAYARVQPDGHGAPTITLAQKRLKVLGKR